MKTTPKQWHADIDITTPLAADLIGRQFPLLRAATVDPLGRGWDNAAFLVDDQFVFRFPCRQIAANLIRNEVRVLPALAPHLPALVPTPEYLGSASAAYPYDFYGYRQLHGTTACRLELTETDRARLAAPIAQFLSALHGQRLVDSFRHIDPGVTFSPTDMHGRLRQLQAQVPTIVDQLEGIDPDILLEVCGFLAATTSPLAGQACWIHGDLYARHLLLDDQKSLSGVIDWGDVHMDDPALDLSIMFSFLPPSSHSEFRTVYDAIDRGRRDGDGIDHRTVDENTWKRARFRALQYGVTLLAYGADIGDEALRNLGRLALRNAL